MEFTFAVALVVFESLCCSLQQSLLVVFVELLTFTLDRLEEEGGAAATSELNDAPVNVSSILLIYPILVNLIFSMVGDFLSHVTCLF